MSDHIDLPGTIRRAFRDGMVAGLLLACVLVGLIGLAVTS